MITPWFILQPGLLRAEATLIARSFPEMHRDDAALVEGTLAFEGVLSVAVSATNHRFRLRLEYPAGFPYARPEVIPFPEDATVRDPHFFSARHQMAHGSICLFEQDPDDDPRAYVTGSAALQRALTWVPHAIRGSLPMELDNEYSDLEVHYQRQGDVLVGPLLYGDLERSGELLLIEFRHEHCPLFIVTHLESGGEWRSDEASMGRIAPKPAEFWSGTPPKEGRRVRWYALDAEPPPVRTSAELAALLFPDKSDALDILKRAVASARHESHAVDVPVRVPGRRVGEHEWLFFRFPVRGKTQPRQRVAGIAGAGIVLDLDGADVLDDVRPLVLRVHDLRQRSLQVRNSGRVPVESHGLRLALGGAGALGSISADLLAKAGVGGLRIIDPAVLDVHNAVRHTGGVGAAGLPKALIVARAARDHNPHCDVTFEPSSVLELPSDDPFWSATAILSTIANDATELALNRSAVARGATVYYLRGLRSGSAGRLVRVRPGLDACLECVANYHVENDSRALVIPRREDEVVARECGQPVLAASAADLAIVGGLGVRQLLADLVTTAPVNQWVWTSEGIPELAALQGPFSSAAIALPPHPRCAICRQGVVRRIRIPEQLRTFMVDQARRHAPAETGGILVGRRTGDAIEVLFASEAGPSATSSSTRFERDGPYSQAFLDRVAGELPGVDYVGEWHSHPGSSPDPSTRDVMSFQEIAADPDYATTAPALVIVAPSSSDEGVEWSHTLFPTGGIARPLELEQTAAALDGVDAK